ncbi:FAD-binding protein [Roseibacterium sp. SDUM158017]|uniref:FAD-binding protein n=1 Tax=Roseicyclus salinarum TaxID=3036773 RepID=UPI002414FA14|nr:FAD-binding protein [Roseibacterium sp. SDUM158017]MDG4649543.1 FAD-binding protein [Roseibacterium sp. SDUM158017]
MPTPASESELSEAVAAADGPLRVIGGGTRPVGRPVAGAALSVAGLTGVELYEPGALTIVVRAGTPLAEVEALLASENQRLPFEPMDHRALLGTAGEPTIGGVVAANVSGPRRIQAGACRDSLIGVRFVDGRGEVLKNGGRVMKNVTGYDLVKLMAGSWGTLGVLTEVAFKVLPATEQQASVLIDGLSGHQAVEAMATALGSPFEVSGAAHLPWGGGGTPVTMLRLEGFAASVEYRLGRLSELMAPFGAVRAEVEPDAVASAWRAVRDVLPFAEAPGDVWRISVKPSDGPDVAARTEGETFLDWGGGLIWARVEEGTDLRARLGAFAGHATLVRASEETRARIAPFQPEPAPIAALSQGLRDKFDPRGILNPGLMAA